MKEMKNSGVDWIGDIPAHWEVKRLKDVVTSGSGTTPKSSNEKYYDNGVYPWLITGDVQNNVITSNNIFITDLAVSEVTNLKLFPEKTVLLAMYGGGTIGNVGLMTYPAYINQACCALIPSKNIAEKYLFYYLLNKQERIISTGVGGTQINLSQNKIVAYPIAIPPIEEQQAIADYLDEKTAEIDEQISLLEQKQKAYVNLKQSLISQVVTRGLTPTAELKDSGIEWIGKIPAHWEIRRLKDVSSFVNGYAFDSKDFETDDGIKVIRIGDIGQSVDFENCARAKTDSALLSGYKINDGDILLAMSGATTGKTCIVYNPQEAFINQRVGIIRSKMSKMIFYLLQTPYFLEFINLYNTGSAQPNISSKDVGEFPIIVVPAEERQMLTDYLDKKTAEIDEQISNIDKKINTYKRLKQSLIDEVVTGKRKI